MDRTEELLAEQVRLLKKADKRGGCLWNLVMVVLFGFFYIAWLILKRLAKWSWWLLVTTWKGIRWCALKIAAGARALWRFVASKVRR